MDNKQTLRTRVGRWLWIPLFVTLGHFVWSVFLSPEWPLCSLQLLHRPSHQVLTTCFVVSGRKLQQAPEAQALHMVILHIHFLLLLLFLVQFPSPLGCRSQFLGYEHFLLFPLRSTVGTFLHTVICICQHGNPKSAEAACCSQHLPHLFVLSRYKLGLLHSKTVIKKKLLPVRTGTRKR